MSQDHSAYDDGFLWSASNRSSTLLTQLDSLVITMHHVDEYWDGWHLYSSADGTSRLSSFGPTSAHQHSRCFLNHVLQAGKINLSLALY